MVVHTTLNGKIIITNLIKIYFALWCQRGDDFFNEIFYQGLMDIT